MFYVENIIMRRTFSLGPLVLLAPLGWLIAKPRSRDAIMYAVIVSVTFLIAVSLLKTRYYWYDAPVYPWLAISCAIAIHAGLVALREGRLPLKTSMSRLAPPIVMVGVLAVLINAAYNRYLFVTRPTMESESHYGPFLEGLMQRGFQSVTVVEPDRDGAGALIEHRYHPILRFYALLHESRDRMSIDVSDGMPGDLRPPQLIASCNPRVKANRLGSATLVAKEGDCWAAIAQ